jgi:TonB family protein
MHRDSKEKKFIKKPIYEGGPKAMREFIKKTLKYPATALKGKVEGTVVVKYSINHLGKVVDTKVISSLGHGCDEEAIRIVKLLKFQVPRNRGVKVLFHKDIKIHFRLPKQQQATVQYTYAEKKKDKSDKDSSSGGSYHYVINI